jgi:hypothetical protein
VVSLWGLKALVDVRVNAPVIERVREDNLESKLRMGGGILQR